MASDLNETRIRAMKLVARAEGDPDFAERARNSPEDVLREAGLPETLLAAPQDRKQEALCSDFTCWSSECPGTCFVTIPSGI